MTDAELLYRTVLTEVCQQKDGELLQLANHLGSKLQGISNAQMNGLIEIAHNPSFKRQKIEDELKKRYPRWKENGKTAEKIIREDFPELNKMAKTLIGEVDQFLKATLGALPNGLRATVDREDELYLELLRRYLATAAQFARLETGG